MNEFNAKAQRKILKICRRLCWKSPQTILDMIVKRFQRKGAKAQRGKKSTKGAKLIADTKNEYQAPLGAKSCIA